MIFACFVKYSNQTLWSPRTRKSAKQRVAHTPRTFQQHEIILPRQYSPSKSSFYLQSKMASLEAIHETAINIFFIGTGAPVCGTKTREGLHCFASLTYYSRVRFIVNPLPLLKRATVLRRLVTVFTGSKKDPFKTMTSLGLIST